MSEPLRTSPTANTPGTDVSNGSGARAANAGPSAMAVGQVAVGEHEALVVERHGALQPRGRRLGADEAEQAGARHGAPLAGGRVLEAHLVEVALAARARDLGARAAPRCRGSASMRSTR